MGGDDASAVDSNLFLCAIGRFHWQVPRDTLLEYVMVISKGLRDLSLAAHRVFCRFGNPGLFLVQSSAPDHPFVHV